MSREVFFIKQEKCFFLEQVSKRPGRYDEMPKSATMENRHNLLEQQFYATVQRKTPALTPFSSGYEVDTIEQLKRAVRSQVGTTNIQLCNTNKKLQLLNFLYLHITQLSPSTLKLWQNNSRWKKYPRRQRTSRLTPLLTSRRCQRVEGADWAGTQ